MTENKKKTGRNPKKDPAVYRYTVRFNAEEHVRFLAMFDESGTAARSVFIKQQFFSQPFRVIKTERAAAPDSSNIARKRTCSSALKRTV